MKKKAEFFNVWRDVLVPVETMMRIAAMCDVIKDQDTPEGRAAKFIRNEIDQGLLYYPNWHEVEDDNCEPTEGEEYLCVDEEGYTIIAEYCGKNDDGTQGWYIYRHTAIRVYPTYWMELPHTPYDDLRDPLRAPDER